MERKFMGVDYHKRYSHVTVLDEGGRVLRLGKIPKREEAVAEVVESLEGGVSAVLEGGRNWMVMHDWLEAYCEEVKLAHPQRVKAIASAKIKTDEIDSRVLADLLGADLIPEAHVPRREVRLARNVLRQRLFLVRMRTMVKNRIHGLVDRHPELPKGEGMKSDLFGKGGMTWLRELELCREERRLLDGELHLLDTLNELVSKSDGWVRELGRENREVELLSSLPGIGKFFAVLLWSEIDGIARFASPKKLCSYAGLVPSTYSSGGKSFHGRLTKRGNKWIRWAMLEAVVPAISHDFWLRAHYDHIKSRAGSNPAKVAVARRLLTLVYRVLKERRPYRLVKDEMRMNIKQSVENRKVLAAPIFS